MSKTYKQWTKEELREFVSLWDTNTGEELAEKFAVSRQTINGIAKKFKDSGYHLQSKRKNGTVNLLIKEVIAELPRTR